MRWVAAIAPILLLATRAHADARIDQIVKGYEHEQTSCKIHEGGVAKMLDGATMLLERGHEDGLAEDVKSLHLAHEAVASYCTALATTIDFLKGDPSASYKALEKEIGARDTHIRSLRGASKKALDETEPLIQRWIPKINAARIDADKSAVPKATPTPKPPDKQPEKQPEVPVLKSETKPLPPPPPPPREEPVLKSEPKPDATPVSAKFPSGRAIKLPQLGGKWEVRGDSATDVAEYIEGITRTSVVAEATAGVSCTSQLARLQAKAYGRQAVKEQARAGLAWRVSLPGDSTAIVACASTRSGSATVTFDAADASHPDLSDLAWQMLASLAK